MAPLCRTLNIEGHLLQVDIYRDDSSKWILEVVDSLGNSTVWNDQFETDQLAFEELFRTIREESVLAILNTP
jgi:RPA family protein